MTQPLVSVLIPCFNADAYVGETLESVLRQTWPAIEVIVVDDGSTDQSVREIRRFGQSKLHLVEKSNLGASAARNEAFRRSSGSFIQFLDADDLICSDKIQLQMLRLLGTSRSVASAEWGRFGGRAEETVFNPEVVWRDLNPLDWLALSRQDGLGMMLPALWLIPRGIVVAAGPWRENLSLMDDTEYYTRILLNAERVLFTAGARCYYRSGIAGSLSNRKSAKAWASQFEVIELCQQRVLSREDSERMRRAFALSWQHLAHACYPYDRRLAEAALGRARASHPARIRPDGGPLFRAASRIIGWRAARRLQVASGRQ
jgi:glycosyltransferase involved in cell wall biosynthesis